MPRLITIAWWEARTNEAINNDVVRCLSSLDSLASVDATGKKSSHFRSMSWQSIINDLKELQNDIGAAFCVPVQSAFDRTLVFRS